MEDKLTVMEMSTYLGVSKEAIYNRLRRGTLESITENGKKYVLLTKSLKREGRLPKRTAITKAHDSEYIELLKTQIEELKVKNQKLENDKEQLQYEKEKMLIESKDKIEQIYKDRDEQLKTILTLANVPSLGSSLNSMEETIDVVEELDIEEDIVEKICESFEDWENLKEYARRRNFSKDERKLVQKRIKRLVGINDNVKESDGELYIKKDVKLKKIIGNYK
ncbi:hypothetical protein [Sulfurospirillum arcachonense]|uniref:hypothetical protein n=1 Tax=Sulfurospirillum arcachonense TaxID=57666 RepID=UPI000468364E|nr:hypothetical protein [Sulfurospirillum arcachonense]